MTSTSAFPKSHTQPIGIFDSGVGGLSIVKCVKENLPNEHFIYVADTLNAPYGDKTVEQIQTRVNVICDYLIAQNVKAIVMACNTATVNAIAQLRNRINIPIIGVEPAIKPASEQSSTKKVGILVTQATAHNPKFLNLVSNYKQGSDVFIQACPGLVDLIENGHLNSPHLHKLLSTYLIPLKEKSVDTIVLGCTHYPFVTSMIQSIMGEHIRIMETALPVTEQLKRQLIKFDLISPHNNASSQNSADRFISTSASPELEKVFKLLWNKEINLESVSL